MTKVLLRLKLALLRNYLRGASGGRVGAALVYAVPFLLGLGAAGLLIATRGAGPVAVRVLALAMPTLLFTGWVVGPIVTIGLDATVDPMRLSLFPITPRQMTVGLFVTAILGGGGLFTALALIGLVGAVAPVSLSALITLAAAVLTLSICVAAARATAAGISTASRRVRDTLIFAVPLVILLVTLLPGLLSAGVDREAELDLSGIAGAAKLVAQVLPTGPAGMAMANASEGRFVMAALWLAAGVVWLLALLHLWSMALRRSLVVPMAAAAERSRSKSARPSDALFPAFVRWLPRSRVGAVAAKELRVTWRDPRQRTALMGAAFGSLAFTLSALADPGPFTVLRSCVIAFFIGANATNLYGFDGGSHWMNVAAGDDAHADLAGKCLARALLAAVGAAVMLAALATFTGGWPRAGQALALCVAGLGLGIGPAAWVSVAYPSPAPANQRNVFAGSNSGQGVQVLGPILLISLVGFAVLAGLGWLMATGSAVTVGAAAVGAIAIGPGVYFLGFWRAVTRSQSRQPELLFKLTKA